MSTREVVAQSLAWQGAFHGHGQHQNHERGLLCMASRVAATPPKAGQSVSAGLQGSACTATGLCMQGIARGRPWAAKGCGPREPPGGGDIGEPPGA
ncbi:hypothetical protein L7F22_000674 [Adiantum nelumboides]|nr:hypothetical protein [Adiantum nelumboides]